uniref:Ankyrin repeat domain 44 n=1 Tax=Electrophorus electricus TaxID=8005 RepID=A0A4W4EFE0_ELEEL
MSFTCPQPPLVQAIFSGDPDEIRMLIYKSEDINALDTEKRTPLHAAAFLGDAEITELLILSGSVAALSSLMFYSVRFLVSGTTFPRRARVNAKDNMWLTPLHRAVASRSEEAVSVLIRHSADVNARDKNWQTPLHVAAANKALRCAELLIPLLSSVNVSDRGGRSALHHAALNGHTEMVSLLLAKGANINAFDKRDSRALHWAAYTGHLDVVCLLVDQGAEVSCKDKRGYTPLHTAASSGQISVVKHLLSLSVDEANAFGNTALHVACFNGQDAVVSELIDFGANVSQPNNKGFTPLHFAAASTHGALCLEFLVNNGADVNVQSRDGKSPLHMTAVHGRFTRSQTLIQNGGEIDCVDKDGNTPLHIAARYGHELLINTLITSGADCTRRGVHGMFPLHLAALNAHADCCRKLLSSGFQIDTPDSLGRTCLHAAAAGGTPLHYAAASRHFQCLETLVSCGTCINATDQWGRCALHYAAASDLDRRCMSFATLYFLLRPSGNVNARFPKLICLLVLEESRGDNGESSGTWSPLHLAAYHGQAQALELLLQGHCEVERCDEVGRTALALSCLRGHADCTLTLLNHGASVHSRDMTWGRTPVHLAGTTGLGEGAQLHKGKARVRHNVNVTCALVCIRTPLMLAVLGGHVDAVSLLLERETSVDTADHRGLTALHLGLLGGQEECVQCLLEQETSVLLGDSRGRTALHLAAARGHASWLSELLSIVCGEPPVPQLRDRQGYTPLHWACYNGHESCVEVLLEQTGSRCLDGNPFTPLHCAVVNDHEACATLLLEALGSEIVTCKDSKDRTPLHAAAFAGHVDCVQLLLAHDAPVDAVDQSGRTALMMAAERGAVGAVEALLTSASADLGLTDQKGNTALHLACSNGKEECAVLILENLRDAALVNTTNAALQTPLHLAGRGGLKQVVKELLSRGASVQAVDENGLTPALACAPSREVADCLALILATMMHFCSPCSSGAPSPGDLLRSLPRYRKGPHGPQSPRDPSGPSSEGTPTENDSDSETF